MKRLLLLALLCALLVMAAGCSSDTSAETADSQDTSASSEGDAAGAPAAQDSAPETDGADAAGAQEDDAGEASSPDAALSVEEQMELALSLVDQPVDRLYEALGQPEDSAYASSCMGEGEDGELYYDGFTVYTYRDTDGSESVYDVMPAAAPVA